MSLISNVLRTMRADIINNGSQREEGERMHETHCKESQICVYFMNEVYRTQVNGGWQFH